MTQERQVSEDASERQTIERSFILAAECAAAHARVAARANVYGPLSEAYRAVEADLRRIATKASRGEEIRNNNGLVWLASALDRQ